MDWAEELIKCRRFKKLNQGIVERFIEKVTVNSATEITVTFRFHDIFAEEKTEGGSSDVL